MRWMNWSIMRAGRHACRFRRRESMRLESVSYTHLDVYKRQAEVKEELSKPQTPSLADLLIAYYKQRNAGAVSYTHLYCT